MRLILKISLKGKRYANSNFWIIGLSSLTKRSSGNFLKAKTKFWFIPTSPIFFNPSLKFTI